MNDNDSVDDLSGSYVSFDSSSESYYSSIFGSEYGGSIMSELGSSFNNSSNLSGMRQEEEDPTPTNPIGLPAITPTYPEGEFEDDKAQMIARLMKNHAKFVTTDLVDRSNLISSIKWLSHHVPECVMKTLFKIIVRARKKQAKLDCLHQRLKEKQQQKQSKGIGEEKQVALNDEKLALPPLIRENMLPITKKHESALLFLDISGFTKLSITMEVESLSNAINSYFQMIVNEITSHGGDILKFAGDAIFAEWKVSHGHKSTHHNLQYCVSLAAHCAAAIVANCSDYAILSNPIGMTSSSRRTSLVPRRTSQHESTRSSMISSGSSMRNSLRNSMISVGSIRNSMLSIGEPVGGELLEEQKATPPQDPDKRMRRASVEAPSGSGVNSGEKPRIHRRASVESQAEMMHRSSTSSEVATLNVKCGVGAGHIVGIHVGDDFSRREYLILGEPIGQVARAEGAATHGEVFASPEAVKYLVKRDDKGGNKDWEEAAKEGKPVLIANRDECYFDSDRMSHRDSALSNEAGSMLRCCDDLDTQELEWLKKMISLYVHPVVVNDDNERAMPTRRGSEHDRHLAEAELRNVYTAFITPQIDYKLTGDDQKDQELFILLNAIMNVTTRELDRVGGHLRQFILDDKGLVLICTFGLRGSTFPNMVAERAVPFTLSVHKALEEGLGVQSTIGATFGKVYCGIVGGMERHEFAALGPSVNLAARLMSFKDNPGVLVDKNVRLLTNQVYFKPLPPVEAKGYDDPVPIFEPLSNATESRWGHVKKDFVGRESEVKEIMKQAKCVVDDGRVSKMLFVSAMSGTGKSTLMVNATEHVRAMVRKMHKKVVITRNISQEGSSRIPFSLFRMIFKDILSQIRYEDEASQARSLEASNQSIRGDSSEFSIDAQWDALSLHSQSSKSSTMSTDATRFRFVCQELNAPPEFVELVGKRLLGLRESGADNSGSNAKPPNLEKIVDFMADAFIRCTRHADLVLLALDDVQWMDDLSWKVVEAIFERGHNVFVLCGSRPPATNPLTVDPKFWSDLHGQYQQDGRYSELSLAPFSEADVHQMIATTLEYDANEIDGSFSKNIFNTSGGMPHYLSYALEAIKRNNLTVRLENGMIGMKTTEEDDSKVGSGSVSELLLYRLDTLDSSVRTVLHLSAVLGMEFDLLDAALAYEEMFGIIESQREETAMALRASFDIAVEEGILEQSFVFAEEDNFEEDIVEEEDNMCHSMGNIEISLKGRKAHPFYTENRCIRFTHDSWKVSILNVMLDERIQEMHQHVAISLERELDNEAHHQDDFEKQIRILKHWKACGSFTKAALIALNVGRELMMLGLNNQAILLFDDVLDILKDMTDKELDDERYGGISLSVLEAIDAAELENLIKLSIAKGKAYATLRQGADGAEAYQNALDILSITSAADDEEFDRSVSFPIFSGLFAVLKMGAIEQDAECSYEKNLCKNFTEQARLNGDPVHYGRALAMEAETLGRLGNFEQALEVVGRIKSIYDIETQHEAICKSYGSDRVAQAHAHSVNFNTALGRTQEALDICDFIVKEIVPNSDPKNIHNTFCLTYAVIITLKENGLALKAREIFRTRVIEPFEEHFGPGGSTYSKPMFKPLMALLDLEGRQDQTIDQIHEYTEWALDESKFEGQLKTPEGAWAAFSASPKAILGEICFCLAKRQVGIDVEKKCRLIQKAISFMEQSVAATASLPFSNMYSRKKLEAMKIFEKEHGC